MVPLVAPLMTAAYLRLRTEQHGAGVLRELPRRGEGQGGELGKALEPRGQAGIKAAASALAREQRVQPLKLQCSKGIGRELGKALEGAYQLSSRERFTGGRGRGPGGVRQVIGAEGHHAVFEVGFADVAAAQALEVEVHRVLEHHAGDGEGAGAGLGEEFVEAVAPAAFLLRAPSGRRRSRGRQRS